MTFTLPVWGLYVIGSSVQRLERYSLAFTHSGVWVSMRVLMLSGQQLTIGHERRWDRGLRAVLDPAATDVQTGGKVWWGDNDSQCVSVCEMFKTAFLSLCVYYSSLTPSSVWAHECMPDAWIMHVLTYWENVAEFIAVSNIEMKMIWTAFNKSANSSHASSQAVWLWPLVTYVQYLHWMLVFS